MCRWGCTARFWPQKNKEREKEEPRVADRPKKVLGLQKSDWQLGKEKIKEKKKKLWCSTAKARLLPSPSLETRSHRLGIDPCPAGKREGKIKKIVLQTQIVTPNNPFASEGPGFFFSHIQSFINLIWPSTRSHLRLWFFDRKRQPHVHISSGLQNVRTRGFAWTAHEI